MGLQQTATPLPTYNLAADVPISANPSKQRLVHRGFRWGGPSVRAATACAAGGMEPASELVSVLCRGQRPTRALATHGTRNETFGVWWGHMK